MKTFLKYIFALFILSTVAVSCSRSTDEPDLPPDELKDLVKIKEVSNETHTIELYSASGQTKLGYNEIKFRIRNKANGQYEKSATVNWMPLMHMATMSHSGPKSAVTKTSAESTLYSGYLVFQMPQNNTEFWDLKIDYTISGTAYSATTVLDVPASSRRTVNSFLGADGARYVVAFVQPSSPKVAINDFVAGIWKMQDMMNFPVVDGYTLKIDPRMPGMGNHTSPNNVHAVQSAAGKLYNGKLSLTMTGYWRINLQLAAADGTAVAGEEVTAAHPESTLFFDVEF